VQHHPERKFEAVEILVLPPTSAYGYPVIAAAPQDLTIKNIAGQLVTIHTKRCRIDTTSPGDFDDIAPGQTILARVVVDEDNEIAGAYEIIVFPDGTAFDQ
jgi:hypothetical protein